MVDQTMGFWNPADAKKPTGVGFSVGGDLTNVPLFELLTDCWLGPYLPLSDAFGLAWGRLPLILPSTSGHPVKR